jgi:TPR repeat protein
MKSSVLLSLLTILLFARFANAAPQIPQSTHQRPQWTEADRKRLLARAQHGDADAQFWLGAGYEQGLFGKSDFQEAMKWLQRAAKHSNPDAQITLGQMYEDGEGVPKNYVLAAQWYRKAAEHVPDLGGAGQGRNHLGLLYLQGLGVLKDYVQAYVWFSLAGVESNLAAAQEEMNPDQILKARQLAERWKKQHPDPAIK